MGDYDVMITGNCGEELSNTAFLDVLTTVNSLDNLDDIQIFPNPSNGVFSIQLEKEYKEVSILVHDYKGVAIYKEVKYNSKEFKIDLSNYSKGSYIVKIEIGNSIKIKKLIIL